MEKKLEGTTGFLMFREFYERATAYKQVMSKRQKLQLAALKRKADKHDLLDDWKPLIDRIFEIWSV